MAVNSILYVEMAVNSMSRYLSKIQVSQVIKNKHNTENICYLGVFWFEKSVLRFLRIIGRAVQNLLRAVQNLLRAVRS